MNTILLQRYEELKNCVLIAAGIKNLTPADCKSISQQIDYKTKKNISETTIKRIYGFAFAKYKPSLFTLDTMAKFCDYDGWENFCEKQADKGISNRNKDFSWKLLKQSAEKITGFTLQALKNKSGIPFIQTIPREAVEHHFDDFLQSGYTGTLLVAPAGYGKTIGLCHWIENKMNDDAI